MAAIGAVRGISQQETTTPFCDKNFKFARVSATLLSNLCLAIFHKTLSLGSWAFSQSYYQHYQSLARYEFEIGGGQFFSYLNFGSELVDFCLNSVTHIKEHIPGKVDELDALKKMYGSAAVERLMTIGTKEVPLRKEWLSRQEIAKDGCCFGMSLDFISRYLQKVRLGIAPPDAVKAIAPLYVKGGPDEAQLGQIFYEGLDKSYVDEKTREECLRKLEEKRIELSNWLAKGQKELLALVDLDRVTLAKKMALFDREAKERMSQADVECISHARIKSFYSSNKIMAEAFGLKMNEPAIFGFQSDRSQRDIVQAKLNNFLANLPDGTYIIGLSPEKGAGHAIAYTKTKNMHFLHNPDNATLILDSKATAKRLMEIAETHVDKGICSFGFFLCF